MGSYDWVVNRSKFLRFLREGEPMAKLGGLLELTLVEAAIPVAGHPIANNRAVDLVTDGFDIMVALFYDSGGGTMLIWPRMWEEHIPCYPAQYKRLR